eukprot:TRINITY_DN9010_c0_g1_i1.p1 TRINITY_DN9010_c0_g1~~TRINITY_DN9010_c0_g1_i1.p1  ORF type:complete len:155 (+),score=13.13 TRINITY_DN9010_c0_g1_i1:75-539(+)
MAFFKKRTQQETGVNYLKGAKVNSLAGYICVGGSMLGIPHRRSRSQGRPRIKFDGVSETAEQFQDIPFCYASMERKPLHAYNPDAYRSRLAVEDAPVPYRNASGVVFNSGIHHCYKRRFLTTNAVHLTGEPCDPRTNQGIISASTTFRRSEQAK